ncbi:D-alanine--D-alanine ligase [Neobacillus sp. 19]|uniref:D-alanine--D-alanine ligase n=1 Tax=Neobacillus sp. 19 TaxID=3394458 RepID=UPI003BF72D82
MKVFLIYGGKSAEHDISILTAFSIVKEVNYERHEVIPIYITKSGEWIEGAQLNGPVSHSEALRLQAGKEKLMSKNASEHSFGICVSPAISKEDNAVIFPVLHGPNGEDGTVQGLFEVLDIPYVGAGVLASAAGMDKLVSKQLFQQVGLPQVSYVAFKKREWMNGPENVLSRCESSLAYPMFVKPANMGSSLGISKACNKEELLDAIEAALRYDHRILVEQGIKARELELSILGNDEIRTSVVGEIVKDQDFYDYDEKYINNSVQLKIPADIPEEISKKIQEYAVIAYQAIDGSGLSRCDFFLTDSNEIYINELNTMPGFTQFSMYPLLWEHTGLSYKDLIEELLQLALKRFNEKKAYQTVDQN